MKVILFTALCVLSMIACAKRIQAEKERSKYWMAEEMVHDYYAVYRYENSEVICYGVRADGIRADGGLQCNFKAEK